MSPLRKFGGKKLLICVLLAGIVFIVYDFFNAHGIGNSTGAPPGYTGSPADGSNCSDCHPHTDSTIDNVSWISTDIPPAGFNHTMNYNVTVTIPYPGAKGFELSVLDNFGNKYGDMSTLDANTQLVGSGKYITHTSPGNANPQTWTFQWSQPNGGYGDATIYGAFTVDTNETFIQSLAIQEEACIHCHGDIPVSTPYSEGIFSYSAGNYIRIINSNTSDKETDITLYASDGKLIEHISDAFHDKNCGYFDIDTSPLDDGMYLITVKSFNSTKTLKLIVSR